MCIRDRSTSLDPTERERAVLDFWKEKKIFERSMEMRDGAPKYTFYDGPPTANGKPHIDVYKRQGLYQSAAVKHSPP